VGKFIGPLIGGWVGGAYGLEYAFLAFVFIGLATIFFVWYFMEDSDVNEEAHEQTSQRVLVGQMLRERSRILATAGTGQILAQLTRKGWLVLIPLYAANVLKLDVQTIGIIMSFGSGLDMLFFYISGVIMDKFGRKWAIVPSFVLQGIGVALMPFAGSAFALSLVSAFIGFANGLSSGTMMTLGADFAPSEMRGEFLSMWRLIGDVGFVGAPMMIGTVAQILALQTSIFAVATSGLGAALLFGLVVPETLKRKKPSLTIGE
jgi:MFS family permease